MASVDEDFPSLGKPCNTESCQGPVSNICNAQGTDVGAPSLRPGPRQKFAMASTMTGGVIEQPDRITRQPGGIACGSAVGEFDKA